MTPRDPGSLSADGEVIGFRGPASFQDAFGTAGRAAVPRKDLPGVNQKPRGSPRRCDRGEDALDDRAAARKRGRKARDRFRGAGADPSRASVGRGFDHAASRSGAGLPDRWGGTSRRPVGRLGCGVPHGLRTGDAPCPPPAARCARHRVASTWHCPAVRACRPVPVRIRHRRLTCEAEPQRILG